MKEISDTKKLKYCQDTIGMETSARLLYLQMGERFYNIREERLYEPQWSSWQEFCMEFKDLSQSSISKMMTVYEVLILRYGCKVEQLAEVGWTKLYLIAPLVKSKAEVKEWLQKGASMPRSDLAKEITEAQTGIQMRDCKHPNKITIEYCPDCKEKAHKL